LSLTIAFFLPLTHAVTVGGGLTLGTDIEFFLPDNGTVVSWPAPLVVDYFNISTDSVTFVNASFDGINAHTFTISVSGGNASIVAITKDYVEVVLNAPAGTISKVAFHAVRPVLTVRAISGGGGGGLPVNPPVTPLPAPTQGLPPAANVGLGIIILSVAGAALYSEVRKRRKIPTLFRARYRYKPVKWGKRTKKWWEE